MTGMYSGFILNNLLDENPGLLFFDELLPFECFGFGVVFLFMNQIPGNFLLGIASSAGIMIHKPNFHILGTAYIVTAIQFRL